jgi:ATP-dependent DNA helicase PIF1
MNINFLKNKNCYDRDNHIVLKNDDTHTYFIDGKNDNLVSVTTFYKKFFNVFDADKIIESILKNGKYLDPHYKYYNMSPKEIKDLWNKNGKQASTDGTNLHNDIEIFYNNIHSSSNYENLIENDTIEFEQFLSFYKDHKDVLEIHRTEWLIYSKKLKITGSVDAVFYDKNENSFVIYDWKRSKEINKINDFNKKGLYPIEHLDDCNFIHYSLQLNLYKLLLENLYKIKISNLYLIVLHPSNDENKYKKIKAMNLEKEVLYLLKMRYNELNDLGIFEEDYDDNDNEENEFINYLISNVTIPEKSIDDTLEIMKGEDDEKEFKSLLKKNKEKLSKDNIIVTKKYDEDDFILSEKQQKAWNLMTSGKNIFLTGQGGSGKTMLIKKFVRKYKPTNIIGVTSTTGTSAILIDGVTLHSYLGIGLGEADANVLYLKIKKKRDIYRKWLSLDVLIIDEISMLNPLLFDKIEYLARIIRGNSKPFGGIQLILSGDFFQLPCVNSDDFCFEAKSWNSCIQKENYVYLNENFRQNSDNTFQKILSEIRIGDISEDSINILLSRVNKKLTNDFGILPTKIYSLNCDVNAENEKEMNKLAIKNPSIEFYEYDLEYTLLKKDLKIINSIEEKIKKSTTVPFNLQLCVGAQVMLLKNQDFENQLVNGSRGVVTSFECDIPKVRFLNGIEKLIDYETFEIEENGEKVISYTQIPLKLAFAGSVHKNQGITLDYAEVNLNNIFEYGQAYVALSRVKSLEGLSIKNFNKKVIKANKKVKLFYEKLI